MSEHEWKIGDWCEWGIERNYVWKLCDFPGGTRIHLVNVAGSTAYTTIEDPGLKYLPGCTGWQWQPTPKLQLREGAWYERNGRVVGPCKLTSSATALKWMVGSCMYDDSGKCGSQFSMLDLIREVPAPTPKYRPFANAAEFKPHRDRWVKYKQSDAGKTLLCVAYSSEGITACVSFMTYAAAFDSIVFDDGSPFGVEVTE